MTAASWLTLSALTIADAVALGLLLGGLHEPDVRRVTLLRKRAALCSMIVVLATLAGVGACGWQAYSVLRSDSVVDPANKARALAEEISGAMNHVAAGVVFAPLPLATTLALLLRARRLARLAR